MRKVTQDVRDAVMEKVKKRSGRSCFQSDSTSGITTTAVTWLPEARLDDDHLEILNAESVVETLDAHSFDGPAASEDDSVDGGIALTTSSLSGITLH